MTGVSPTRRTFLRAAAMTAAGSAAAAVTGAGPASEIHRDGSGGHAKSIGW